jgi:hypothetical protein
MDSSSAINTLVSSLSAGGTAGSIAVSLLRGTENAQAQQIATLFSTIGLGQNFNAYA